MSEANRERTGSEVDIEKIMEEIREEVRQNGPYEEIPSFDQVGSGSAADARGLKKNVEELTRDYVIPVSFPDPARNPLKRLFKKAMTKASRCATAPISTKVTETNQALKMALEEAADVIERQQEQIEMLSVRVERLEKAAAAGKERENA